LASFRIVFKSTSTHRDVNSTEISTNPDNRSVRSCQQWYLALGNIAQRVPDLGAINPINFPNR
jgi:hypothetical protein